MGNAPVSGYCEAIAAARAPDYTPLAVAAIVVPIAIVIVLPCVLLCPLPPLAHSRVASCRRGAVACVASLDRDRGGGTGARGARTGGIGTLRVTSDSQHGRDRSGDGAADADPEHGSSDAGSVVDAGSSDDSGSRRLRTPDPVEKPGERRRFAGGILCLAMLGVSTLLSTFLWIGQYSPHHSRVVVRPAPLHWPGPMATQWEAAFSCPPGAETPAHLPELKAASLPVGVGVNDGVRVACVDAGGVTRASPVVAGYATTAGNSTAHALTSAVADEVRCTVSSGHAVYPSGARVDSSDAHLCTVSWQAYVTEGVASIGFDVALPPHAAYDRDGGASVDRSLAVTASSGIRTVSSATDAGGNVVKVVGRRSVDVQDILDVLVFADSCLRVWDLSATKITTVTTTAALRRHCDADTLGPRMVCGAGWSASDGWNDASLGLDPHAVVTQDEPAAGTCPRVRLSLDVDTASELDTALELTSLIDFIPKVFAVLAFSMAVHFRLRRRVHGVADVVAARVRRGVGAGRCKGAVVACGAWSVLAVWLCIVYLLAIASDNAGAVSKTVPRYAEQDHADLGSLGTVIDLGIALLVTLGVTMVAVCVLGVWYLGRGATVPDQPDRGRRGSGGGGGAAGVAAAERGSGAHWSRVAGVAGGSAEHDAVPAIKPQHSVDGADAGHATSVEMVASPMQPVESEAAVAAGDATAGAEVPALDAEATGGSAGT